MLKKIVFSLFVLGFVFVNPFNVQAQTFTSLKTQMFDLGTKIENFKTENKGEVLGVNSSLSITFTANPQRILEGGSSTLSWTSTNATRCFGPGFSSDPNYQEGSAWMSPYEKGISGSQVISNLKRTTRFYISCSGFDGEQMQAETYIEVENRIPEVTLKAEPNTVPFLGSTKLTWSTKNISSGCIASGDWSGNKYHGGSQIISGIKNTKTFNLTCPGYVPGTFAKATVKVTLSGYDDIPDPDKDTGGLGNDGSGLVSDNPEVLKTTTNNICNDFTFKKTLAYGSKDTKISKDVSLMQSVLVDEGLLSSKDATGSFYSKTRSALRSFQKKYKLLQTGRLDSPTMTKMNDLFKGYCSN